MDPIEKSLLPSPFTFLAESFSSFKANFSNFVWFIISIEALELIGTILRHYMQIYLNAGTGPWSGIVAFLVADFVVSVGIAVLVIIFATGFVKSILDAEKGIFAGFGSTLRSASRLFWGIIFLGILMVLIYIGSFSLLIIPGIIVLVYLTFASIALIDQNKRGFKALTSSWEYVRGYWWAVFGQLLFMILFAAIIAIAFVILAAIVFKIAGIPVSSLSMDTQAGFLAGYPIAYTLYTLGSFLVKGLLIAPLLVIYQVKVYRSLVTIKSGSAIAPAAVMSADAEKNEKKWCIAFIVVSLLVILVGISYQVYLSRTSNANLAQSESASTTATSTVPTLYQDAGKAFQMELAPGWAGAPSVAYPAATIFSDASEDISQGVIVVAPILYTSDVQDGATNPATQQTILAQAKTQLAAQDGVVVTGSNSVTPPFYLSYTKPSGDEQGTSIQGREYLFFGQPAYYVVAAEASQENWASSSPTLIGMVQSFKPL